MKTKLLAAAVLAAASASALAETPLGTIDNITVPVFNLVPGGFFQDLYSFTLTDPGTVYGEVLSGGISNFTVSILSTPYFDLTPASFSFSDLAPGIYTLSFLGFPAANGGGYGGFVASVTSPIPESETYALMLAGLGIVGFVAARRRVQG